MSTHKPLREDVRQMVLERLWRGELAPGSRINESSLATELGVSRTPLREALFRLEQEGFVRADMARGFLVMPLTAREIREIYPILWSLEGLALRSAGHAAAGDAAELEQLNNAFAQVDHAPEHMLELDTRWHQALVHRCPNQRLLAMIASLKQVIYRYEWAYMRNMKLRESSFMQHQEIIKQLAVGEIKQAVMLLEAHWRFGMDALLQQLDWL